MTTFGRPPRLQGLDGLRGIAVSAVVLFHAEPDWLPGGFLGVDLFFVISGFLITRQLLTEISEGSGLNLTAFYRRRMRRLFPPMVAMTTVVVVGAAVFWPDEVATLRGDVPAALGYAANWHQILTHRSYFQTAGRPSPLQHLWSLAIEEQFYLCWPVLLVLVTTIRVRRRPAPGPLNRDAGRVAFLAFAGAVASAAWMWVLAVRGDVPYGSDSSRLYFGTDTHAAGLLVGAGLAALSARRRREDTGVGTLPNVAGVVAFAAMVWSFVRVSEFSPGLYRGGFLVIAGLAGLVVVTVTRRGSWLGQLLETPLLRALGVRSYGIYLWHWPVIVVTRPGLDVSAPPALIFLVRLIVPLVLADLSYRLIEQRRTRGPAPRRAAARWQLATAIPAVAALVAVALSPGQSSAATAPPPALAPSHPVGVVAATPPTPVAAAAGPVPEPQVGPVLAVGDSVLLGAASALHSVVPDLRIDAVVGRQARPTLAIVDARKPVPTATVIDTGNNGVIDPADLEKTLRLLRGSRVVLVDDNVPRDWQDPNNAVIGSAAAEHPGVVVFDWLSLSRHHPGWFYDDGYHVRPAGAVAFARGVAKALTHTEAAG